MSSGVIPQNGYSKNLELDVLHPTGSFSVFLTIGFCNRSGKIFFANRNSLELIGQPYSPESFEKLTLNNWFLSKYFYLPSIRKFSACKHFVLDSSHCVFPLKDNQTIEAEIKTFSGVSIIQAYLKNFETSNESVSFSFSEFNQFCSDLRRVSSTKELFRRSAERVKEITGFDRVMVQMIGPRLIRRVLAESKNHDLEPYEGLCFPALDTLDSSKVLYWHDQDFGGEKLVFSKNLPDNFERVNRERLMGGWATIQRVPGASHTETLKKMGARSELVIPICQDDELWGLICCLNYDSKVLSKEVLTATESLGHVIGWQYSALSDCENDIALSSSKQRILTVVENAANRKEVVESLRQNLTSILRLGIADGVILAEGSDISSVGEVPSLETIQSIYAYLHNEVKTFFETSFLSNAMQVSRCDLLPTCGILAFPIGGRSNHWLILCRSGQKFSNCLPSILEENNSDLDNDDRCQHEQMLNVKNCQEHWKNSSIRFWIDTVRGSCYPWEHWVTELIKSLQFQINEQLTKKAAALAKANKSLEDSIKMRDEFLATVSHELRTPLTAINSWIGLMKAGILPEEEIQEAICTIESCAKDQMQLIEDLLDMSRIISGKMRLDIETCSIQDVVDEAVEAIRPALESKHIAISRNWSSKIPRVKIDPDRIRQVIWNLLSNSAKFTPNGGKIVVRIECEHGKLQVIIDDNGSGIPVHQLANIFERFRQVDSSITRKSSGLGLGLAISKQLIELHGGTISAFSEGPGCGSSFTINLPQEIYLRSFEKPDLNSEGEKDIDEASLFMQKHPSLEGKVVLLVEDDKNTRRVVQLLMEKVGMNVHAVESGKKALAKFSSINPDLIVSDIGMPTMDGYALLEHVRNLPAEEGGATKAVALTALTRSQDKSRAFRSGFDGHVPKPVNPHEMFCVFESLLSR